METPSKRKHTDEGIQDGPPTSKQRTETRAQGLLASAVDTMDCREDGEPSSGKWEDTFNWKFPRIFWDNLSRVPLDIMALNELDRRVARESKSTASAKTAGRLPTDARVLARGGGPDLSHVRSLAMMIEFCTIPYGVLMADPKWTTKSSSFAQHLEDHNVHGLDTSRAPDNLAAMRAALAVRRPELGIPGEELTREDFARFCEAQQKSTRGQRLSQVISRRFDVLAGVKGRAVRCLVSSRCCPFIDMRRLTDATVQEPVPDLYDGAAPAQLGAWLFGALGDFVEPAEGRPVVPSFFYEDDRGSQPQQWTERAACYEGAVGARAMHILQHAHLFDGHDVARLPLDGCAYALSATYNGGTLRVYAHHATARGTLEYHMTLVGAYAVTASYEGFVEGATALRNARDLAERHRDAFIEAARARLTPEQVAYDEEAEELQNKRGISYRSVHEAMTAKRESLVGRSGGTP